MAVAEAVEKYQMCSAMNLCELRLLWAFRSGYGVDWRTNAGFSASKFLRSGRNEHAIRILVHAFKYNYAKLVNKAALCLCRTPDLEIVEKSPPGLIIPWVGEHSMC
jgi:hypothetical protein